MGLGRVIGGALQGYGRGTAMVAEQDMRNEASEMEHRRQLALENLRAGIDKDARVHTAELNDLNDARATARDTDASIVRHKVEATTQAERDERLHEYDQEAARIASQLRMSEDAARQRLGSQIEKDLRNGEAIGMEIDGTTGEKVVVYKDGRTVRTGIQATERELTPSSYGGGGTPSALDQARGLGTPAAKPAPAPAPTTKPNTQQSGTGTKTYTMAEAEATAKMHKVTLDEVHRRMRAAGYKLAGK